MAQRHWKLGVDAPGRRAGAEARRPEAGTQLNEDTQAKRNHHTIHLKEIPMQYNRFFSPAFALAIILGSVPTLEAQRPEREPVRPQPAPQSATGSANQVNAQAGAAPVTVGQCELTYERANNMWAAKGRPDGELGEETLTFKPGRQRSFQQTGFTRRGATTG